MVAEGLNPVQVSSSVSFHSPDTVLLECVHGVWNTNSTGIE